MLTGHNPKIILKKKIAFNEEKHLMRGKKSDLGRNDIKNWEIRSFWGRYSPGFLDLCSAAPNIVFRENKKHTSSN
jgi:hypothetical protein